jgi:sugar phosphate isomerase/epimerase
MSMKFSAPAVGLLAICLVRAFPAQAADPPLPTGSAKDFKVRTALHSIGYAGVWRGQAKLSVDDFLRKAKELGYEGVALMAKRPHVSPYDYDDAARKALRARMGQLGLKLAFLAGYTDFTAGMDKPGIPHLEIQALYVGEVARLARDLGTPMVRIFTGYERPGVPYDKQYELVVEGLKMAGREAAKYGITLAVQNHHDIAIHHDAMAWLIKEVNLPNVKVGWDAWSPQLEGLSAADMRRSVLLMKPFLVNTIAADYVKLPRFTYQNEITNYRAQENLLRAVPMGKGIVDYKTFIGALKEIGYQGFITYEMCEVLDGGGSVENLDRTARAFLTYVKQFDSGSRGGSASLTAR